MKPLHDDLFAALKELSEAYPDWRLGQLVCNVAGWTDVDVWDVEDQQLLEAIQKQKVVREKLSKNQATEAAS